MLTFSFWSNIINAVNIQLYISLIKFEIIFFNSFSQFKMDLELNELRVIISGKW